MQLIQTRWGDGLTECTVLSTLHYTVLWGLDTVQHTYTFSAKMGGRLCCAIIQCCATLWSSWEHSAVSTMGDIHRQCSKCVSSNCTNLGPKFEHSTLQCQRWLKDWQYVHTAHSAFHHSPQIKLKFEHSRVSTIGERLTVCAPGYLGWPDV